jgi:uncharacterized protein (TIGR02996 family)
VTTELETALADFATARTGTLALHIDELGRAALASFTPPEPRKNIEFHRAWLELADDPNARTWCLDSLLERLPKLIDGNEHRSGDKCDALVERLVVLRDAAPDPRIGRAMLTLLELRAPVANFTTVHEEIARVIVRHADDETALSSALDEVRELDRNALPKPAAARAAKPKRDLEALYAAVYAAPDDDAPRAVLADALTDAGDPRGELIALQLREAAGDATPEMTERARELVQTHAKSWLGSLRPIVYRAELRRGFLHTLELEGSYATRKWDELARDPALATVEELETGQATGKVVTWLLAGTIARTIRSLQVDTTELWTAIATTELPRLRELRAFHWKRKPYERCFVELVVPYLVAHPAITRVGCGIEMVDELPKPVLARLDALTVRDNGRKGSALWAKLPKLRRLRFEWSQTLELERVGKRELARLWPGTFGSIGDLTALPSSITRVEVIGNKRAAKALADQHRKLDIVAVAPPSGRITGVK